MIQDFRNSWKLKDYCKAYWANVQIDWYCADKYYVIQRQLYRQVCRFMITIRSLDVRRRDQGSTEWKLKGDACLEQIYPLPVDCSEKTKSEIDFLSKHNLVNTFTVAFLILNNKLM